jgi:hypothetical protein
VRAFVASAMLLVACHRTPRTAVQTGDCHPDPHVVRPTTTTVTSDIGVVEGTVLDAWSLKPLEAATVLLVSTQVATRADASGRFRLARLPVTSRDTTVIIRVLRVGFEQQRDTVVLPAGQGAQLKIYMSASQVCLSPVATGI